MKPRAGLILALALGLLAAPLAAGCDDFDIKPIDLDRLLGKIEALLGRRATAR